MDIPSLSTLTGWDWFVLIVFALSVLLGVLRGLVRTVFGLAAWVVALLGAPLLAPAAIEAAGMQAHPWVMLVLLFLALFLLVRLLGGLLARGLGRIGLGGADRGLGAVLGAARAVLLILIAAVAARSLDLDQTPSWRDARSRPLLEGLVHWVQPYLPQRQGVTRET